MVLTLQERILVTEQYFTQKLYKIVSEMFQAKFPGKDVLNKSTVSRIIAIFGQHGTVCNLPHDREKTALTPCVLGTVLCELASNDPGTSKSLRQVIREHRNEGLSYGTTHHAMEALRLVSRWGEGAYRKSNNVCPQDVLWQPTHFCRSLASQITGFVSLQFFFIGILKRQSLQLRHSQFGDIENEYSEWDKQDSANNADKCRRKCCEACTSMYFGGGRTMRTFIIWLWWCEIVSILLIPYRYFLVS